MVSSVSTYPHLDRKLGSEVSVTEIGDTTEQKRRRLQHRPTPFRTPEGKKDGLVVPTFLPPPSLTSGRRLERTLKCPLSPGRFFVRRGLFLESPVRQTTGEGILSSRRGCGSERLVVSRPEWSLWGCLPLEWWGAPSDEVTTYEI